MGSLIAKVSYYVMIVLLVLTLVPIELILIGAGIVGLVEIVQVSLAVRGINRDIEKMKAKW